jgi:hypothetical protein
MLQLVHERSSDRDQGYNSEDFERALQDLRAKALEGTLNLHTAAAASVPLPDGATLQPHLQMPTPFASAAQVPPQQQQQPPPLPPMHTPFAAAAAYQEQLQQQRPKAITKANRYDLLLGD